MINIGMVNEMAIMCDRLGVDVWEVIEAAATKPFGYMKFVPGPAWAGTASRSTRSTFRGS
jgi:UDP-N-acetyl-D-glucosamine dehydrogenase